MTIATAAASTAAILLLAAAIMGSIYENMTTYDQNRNKRILTISWTLFALGIIAALTSVWIYALT